MKKSRFLPDTNSRPLGLQRTLPDLPQTADESNNRHWKILIVATQLAADNQHIAETSDTAVRDAFFQDAAEAQWCIFDPIVSVIYGNRYAQTGRRADLRKQIRHLNRSLCQLTGPRDAAGPFRCPELYCLQKGLFLPNDHTPLLWTQANLMMALKVMEDSVTPSSFPSLSSTNPAR